MERKSSWSALPHRDSSISTDERYTPDWVLDIALELMGGIDLDPCADPQKRVPAAQHFTREDNGLDQVWKGRIYMNPPYSGSTQWFKHLALYLETGSVSEALVLVPVTTLSSKGGALLIQRNATAVAMCHKRFNFLNEDYEQLSTSTPIPLCLIYAGSNTERFFQLTESVGYGLLVHQPHPQHKQKQCSYCGKPFTAKRSTARYCSTTCRVLNHRKKKS